MNPESWLAEWEPECPDFLSASAAGGGNCMPAVSVRLPTDSSALLRHRRVSGAVTSAARTGQKVLAACQ